MNSSSLVKALEQIRESEKQIDIICCLEEGSFVVTYEKTKIELNMSTKESSLIFFFINLMSKLQVVGTVPAIDFAAYAKSLS